MKSHSVTRQVTAPVTLTANSVAKVTPGNAVGEIRDAICPGLRLIVYPSGARSWVARFWLNKRHHKVTLGKWPALGLAAARIKARKALSDVAEGRDPRQRDADTFEAAVADYHVRHTPKLRATTRQYITRELAVASKYWRGRTLASITRRDVIAITDDAEKRGGAARGTLLKTLSAFFRWCLSRDLIGASPSVGVRREKYVPRERTLTDDELVTVWSNGDGFVRFLIVSGMRRNECAGLIWSEIGETEIELPPERVKTGLRLRVPVTPLMRDILDKVERRGPYVWRGAKPLHVSGTTAALGVADHWTLHDLRRTMASGMARLGVPFDIVERALGHKIKGVAGVYQKYDYAAECRDAFERWSAHVAAITHSPASR
jgi:integrase